MLCTQYSQESLSGVFLPFDQWKPFPRAHERNAWDSLLTQSLNRERKAYLSGISEKLLNQPWPVLKASDFMDFERTGNRSQYGDPFFARRRNLSALVIAECFEYKGRFLDEIINGIWYILGEITWAVNAHAYRAPLGNHQDPLPPLGDETLALFSIQTAGLLAETDYLLAEKLEEISPALRQRIHEQIQQRIIEPFERHSEESEEPRERCITRWMDGHNNWTPWCCTNLLTAVMHSIKDMDRLCAAAFKLMKGVDNFIAGYGEDGGCDEGPAYWSHASGAMIRFLEILYSRSEGAIDIFSKPIIKQMGLYLPRMNLGGPWFANFADAAAKAGVLRAVTYRYGERVNAPEMQALVIKSSKDKNGRIYPPIQANNLMHMLRELFWMPETLPDIEFRPEEEVWLSDLQVMVSRDTCEENKGLVLAAKGGHNRENHNHNDLGHVIIFSEGTPFIIDVGSEIYTRTTFSKDRYTLWTHHSLGHNVPCINGWKQADGEEFRATDVVFESDKSQRSLSMHLEKAYPDKAGIVSLQRRVEHVLGTSPCIKLTDKAEVKKGPAKLLVPFYTPFKPEEKEQGCLMLTGNGTSLAITFNPESVQCALSTKVLSDKKLQSQWGPKLHRIEFTAASDSSSTELELTFKAEKD